MPTSSRLARHQQEKLLRQTVMMIVGAVILIGGFIFIVLPAFVRLVVGLGGGSGAIDSGDTFAPQTPVLATLPQATPSGTLALRGFGEPQSTVVAVVNGSQAGESVVNDDSQFSFEISLEDGSNSIAVFARDEAGNESAVTSSALVIRDNQPPLLEIGEPQDGQQVELRRNQTITIRGKTDPGAEVSINGRRVFGQADGTFSTTYLLQEGDNLLTFIATDQAGNQTKTEMTVKFRL